MKTRMWALALLAALCATPAIANETAQAKATDPKAAEQSDAAEMDASKERVVCERVRTVGSNRVERVCKTVKQREEDSKSDRNAADRMMRSSSGRAKLGDG